MNKFLKPFLRVNLILVFYAYSQICQTTLFRNTPLNLIDSIARMDGRNDAEDLLDIVLDWEGVREEKSRGV